MVQTGTKGHLEITVTQDKTAKAMGSGELEVFATPAMISLIEETAWRSVSDLLEPGEGTVGTRISISHVSATPVGIRITCETEVTVVDRRRIVFDVRVFDEFGKIGEGTHERFIVQNDRFLQKAGEKSKQTGRFRF